MACAQLIGSVNTLLRFSGALGDDVSVGVKRIFELSSIRF